MHINEHFSFHFNISVPDLAGKLIYIWSPGQVLYKAKKLYITKNSAEALTLKSICFEHKFEFVMDVQRGVKFVSGVCRNTAVDPGSM